MSEILYRRGPETGILMTPEIRFGIGPAIVLWDPKYPHNVGQIVRLSSCYGIAQVWSCGNRVPIITHSKDFRLPREERMKGYGDVALFNCAKPLDQFEIGTPFIAIEFTKKAENLHEFSHPVKGVYVFGPEDGSLPVAAKKKCWGFVTIPTKHCLNLATAVATVLYDRATKMRNFK